MSSLASYKTLGLKPGATEAQIKTAYRRLAKQYHPDKNKSPQAAKKFQLIAQAYEELTKNRPIPYQRDKSYERAAEILRQERRKVWEKAKQEKSMYEEGESAFKKNEFHDLFLLLKYLLNGFLLIFSIAAVLVPIVLAIVIEPVVLLATIYFVIIGCFLLWHIYTRRKTWFKLGKLNNLKKTILTYFKNPSTHPSNETCFFINNKKADGKAYHIKLIRVVDIKFSSHGALDHKSSIKQKATNLIIPRSATAEKIHHILTIIKIFVLLASIAFFPLSSIFWRFIAGLIMAMISSGIVLKIYKVKSKSSYLLTPALIIKAAIWLLCILSISIIGPGFDLALNEYKFIVFAGLLFLLDMLFDLLFGLFPFYSKLFRPILRQGEVLNKLYREGYQNYIDYPFYSIILPFLKWVF